MAIPKEHLMVMEEKLDCSDQMETMYCSNSSSGIRWTNKMKLKFGDMGPNIFIPPKNLNNIKFEESLFLRNNGRSDEEIMDGIVPDAEEEIEGEKSEGIIKFDMGEPILYKTPHRIKKFIDLEFLKSYNPNSSMYICLFRDVKQYDNKTWEIKDVRSAIMNIRSNSNFKNDSVLKELAFIATYKNEKCKIPILQMMKNRRFSFKEDFLSDYVFDYEKKKKNHKKVAQSFADIQKELDEKTHYLRNSRVSGLIDRSGLKVSRGNCGGTSRGSCLCSIVVLELEKEK